MKAGKSHGYLRQTTSETNNTYMAITPTISYAMTDAEFLTVNGVAAPTITKASPLYDLGATATASAGTTTITLPVGQRNSNNIGRLAMLMGRIASTYRITYTN